MAFFAALLACHPTAPVQEPAMAAAGVPDLPDLVEFPVPVREVAPGHTLVLDDLVWMTLPQDYVPKDGVVSGADGILGRVTTERLLPFEFVRVERLAPEPAATPMPPDARPTLGSPFHPEPERSARRENEPMLRAVPGHQTVMVIVAARDLARGAAITEQDLYAVQIPPEYLPEGVFLSPKHVVGREVCERILPNELVRAVRLHDPEGSCRLR